MEVERAGLLILAIIASIIVVSIVYKLSARPGLSGSKLTVLDGINAYAEKCESMKDYRDCYVLEVNSTSRITSDDISKLSSSFQLSEPIPSGLHKIKMSRTPEGVVISVVS